MPQISRQFDSPIHDLWGLFLAEGIALLLLGTVAIVLPPLAGLAVTILLGWLLIASAIFGVLTTLMNRGAPGFWWALASALITGAVGAMLFAWPLGGLISLSLALAAFLTLDGLLAMGMAFAHRQHLTSKWAWLLVNGIADLIFAIFIIVWLPQSAAWALGLIVGIDMLISGATLVVMALDARKA